MTSRQLDSRDLKGAPRFAQTGFAAAASEPAPRSVCDRRAAGGQIRRLPHRPDAATLCETIPLFYVGRNRFGFWVAREAEGKVGGLFVRKRSALRFAGEFSERQGRATMFLSEPFELDIENQGGRLTALLAAAMEIAARRVPAVVTFVGLMVAEWRKLVAEISRIFDDGRRNRAAIERDLFRGHYQLMSKNDDDLPIQ